MTGQTVILHSDRQRAMARRLVDLAPKGAVVNIKEAARTNDQNSKLWAMLSDISRAKPEGRVLSPDAWKVLFMQAAGFKFTWEPGLDGEGVVPVGFKSSRLNKAEFGELLECVAEYGARHGVDWSDQESEQEERAA